MQRLRIRFTRGEAVKYISHLDIMRLWERAIHRARVRLAYSEGFNPRPRISLALPLAVGVTSDAEMMDIFLTDNVSPHWFKDAATQQMPPGIEITGVYQIAPVMPSLQSQVRFAEYMIEVEKADCPGDVDKAVADILAMGSLPWHHMRDTGRRDYDLRALIDDIWLAGDSGDCYTIGMRLRCDNIGSGRPEQVALALGCTRHPRSIHRTRLILEA